MIQELVAASQSLSALTTILNAAKDLSNFNEITAAVSEVNSKLMAANSVALAAQEKQSLLAQRVQELEQEIMQIKNWESEKKKYSLTEIATGIFSQVKKPVVGDFESAHKLCATCFEQMVKSPLQQQNIPEGRQLSLCCFACNNDLVFYQYKSHNKNP